MKPLILFTTMTVIGLFGIIGTVEYAHADHINFQHRVEVRSNFEYMYQDELHERYNFEPPCFTDLRDRVPQDANKKRLMKSQFNDISIKQDEIFYFISSYPVSHDVLVELLSPHNDTVIKFIPRGVDIFFDPIVHKHGLGEYTFRVINSSNPFPVDDHHLFERRNNVDCFGSFKVNVTESYTQNLETQYNDLQTRYNNLQSQPRSNPTELNQTKTELSDLQTRYNDLESQYNNLQTQYSSTLSTLSDLQSQYNTLQTKAEKLKDKKDLKIERKDLWKERWNTCFENKENIKTQLETTTQELNQYKLDIVNEQNQCTQLLNDHETQITTLEINYNLLQQNLTDAEFTIEKLKQEKADLIKKVETLETQLQEN